MALNDNTYKTKLISTHTLIYENKIYTIEIWYLTAVEIVVRFLETNLRFGT